MKYYNSFNDMFTNNTTHSIAVNNSMEVLCLADEDDGTEEYRIRIRDDESGEEIFDIKYNSNWLFQIGVTNIEGDLGELINYINDYVREEDNEDDPALLVNSCTDLIKSYLESISVPSDKYKITEYGDGSVDITVDNLAINELEELAEQLDGFIQSSYDYWT